MASRDLGFSLLGAAALAVIVAVAVCTGAALGIYDVAADSPHNPITAHFFKFVRERSIAVRADGINVPPLDRADMISDGASDYDEMCTSCHLAPGMPENEMRPGLNPKPPLLAAGKVGNPKVQFWIIKHGIKMTAMSAWGRTHSDEEIWNIVAFL